MNRKVALLGLALFLGLWMLIVSGLLLHYTLTTPSATYKSVAKWFAAATIAIAGITLVVSIYIGVRDHIEVKGTQ